MTADHGSRTALSQFIAGHHEEIIERFATFARTLMPPGSDMTDQELRDHAEELLTAIAIDMETTQSLVEQSNKSMGWGTAHAIPILASCTPTLGCTTASP